MQERKHSRRSPGAQVEHRGRAVGQDATDVVGESAACDVGGRVHWAGVTEIVEHAAIDRGRGEQDLTQRRAGRHVAAGRYAIAGHRIAGGRKRRVESELMLGHERPHEREAVGVQAVGGDADERVAGLHAGGAPQLVAAGDADREAGQVERVVVGEMPGVLGGLAAEQRALGSQAAFVDAGDDVGHLLRLDLADDQVIEKEQRHGAAGRDVVDAHCHGVDADRVVDAHLFGQQHLGAGAVGAGHQHGVVDRRQAHEPAETADALEHQRVMDRLEPFLEQTDGFVAGRHVDARVFVGEVFVGGHDPPSFQYSTLPARYSTVPARRAPRDPCVDVGLEASAELPARFASATARV